MGHARLSPSQAHRWMVCPGSVRLEAQYPDTDNEYSLRGSGAHFVAEECLKTEVTPGFYNGQTVLVDKVDGTQEEIQITQEDTDAIWVYVDYVHRRMEELAPVHAEFETKLNPGAWFQRGDCEGTGDCVLFSNEMIEIIDYKHGSGVTVEAEDNLQLLLYAIGACARMDWNQLDHGTPVQMTIVQPRAQHPDGPVRSWVLPARDIFARVPEIKEKAIATDSPVAFLAPGDKQCRWCKAKGDCPAIAQEAISAFTTLRNDLPLDARVQVEAANLYTHPEPWDEIELSLGRPADQLSPETVANILDKKPLIQAWLKAVTEHATKLALDGGNVPGYKVVEGKSNRKWNMDEEALILKLASLKHREDGKKSLGQKTVTVTKPVSPAQAEKIIQPLVTERTWRNVQKLIIKPEGAPTLVPMTDPREPMKGPEQVFEKQEELPAWLA